MATVQASWETVKFPAQPGYQIKACAVLTVAVDQVIKTRRGKNSSG